MEEKLFYALLYNCLGAEIWVMACFLAYDSEEAILKNNLALEETLTVIEKSLLFRSALI